MGMDIQINTVKMIKIKDMYHINYKSFFKKFKLKIIIIYHQLSVPTDQHNKLFILMNQKDNLRYLNILVVK